MSVAPALRISSDSQRRRLFRKYADRITPNLRLDRKLVSFQANRGIPFFRWMKYKEGFSAPLVETFVNEFGRSQGGTLLDPFAGSGTALLVARERGWDAIGIELMPVGVAAIEARLAAECVRPSLLKRHIECISRGDWDVDARPQFMLRHIPITRGAFSAACERSITAYRAYCQQNVRNAALRKLMDFACLAVLESVSFTRKDGQYLRWDARAAKPRVKADFNKGRIPSFREAVIGKLNEILADLSGESSRTDLFNTASQNEENRRGTVDLRCGSCLDILPTLPDASVDLIVTSPPYCNRYDYTRTYALELVFLGLGASDVNSLRQQLLSCTVENRAKIAELRAAYEDRGVRAAFERILRVFEEQEALHEVLRILDRAAKAQAINNVNIPRMVRNYFLEMCIVIYELARVLGRGGRAVMVNDNVRYAGEEVPVDLILSDFVERFGLEVEQIWTLPRGKGNSSQQMGLHGRSELRKCVYVWRKP